MDGQPVDDLALVVDFLNTVDVEAGMDDFARVETARGWFGDRGLPGAGRDLDEAALERTRSLRSALRQLAGAHHDQRQDTEAAAAFNAVARGVPLRPAAQDDGDVRVLPAGQGVDAALGRIVAAVAHASAVGTWPRVKICSADTCRWAFIDASKNRSRRWCAMGVCGNREKTRAYRQRQRESS